MPGSVSTLYSRGGSCLVRGAEPRHHVSGFSPSERLLPRVHTCALYGPHLAIAKYRDVNLFSENLIANGPIFGSGSDGKKRRHVSLPRVRERLVHTSPSA